MAELNQHDRDLAFYSAADPHAVTSTKPWELEITSRYLKIIAAVLIVVIMAAHIFVGVMLDAQFTGVTFTRLDQLAFPGVGLIISVLTWFALSRPRLRANSDGVEVRNIVGTRFYPWVVIYGLTFPQGARMARLELPEFEYVPLWAIQAGDGERAVDAVKRFRTLEAEYMPED